MEMILQSRRWVFGIRPLCLSLIAILLLPAIACWMLRGRHSDATALFEPKIEAIQSAPLCPWREPTQDLKSFFPSATRYEAETPILSGMRLRLANILGRPATGDENALHIYRVYNQQTEMGVILTQRVKGAYGAIELVLGVDPAGKVSGIRVQRNREPESIALELQRSEWLGAFIGKQGTDPWKLGEDIPDVTKAASPSADAVVQGARCMLILLQVATDSRAGNLNQKPHH